MEIRRYRRGKTEVEEAIARLERAVRTPERTRTLPLMDALGQVLAEDLAAGLPQPPFTRSAVDGYALRAEDIRDAAPETPAVLPVTAYLPAGSRPGGPLPAGAAARIMTGAPLVPGADCIVPQEVTDGGEERVSVKKALPAGSNICLRGEDIAAGSLLAARGTRLTFAHLGVLAAQGISGVSVYEAPRVAVMATGDELAAPGEPLREGQIYDSNSLLLGARLKELGIRARLLPACPDDPDRLAACLDRLLGEYDLVITTGGVSVGKKDYLPFAADLAGAGLLFYGIAAKPGSPVFAAERGGSVLLALSGNPFAGIATFELLALPALARLSGESAFRPVRGRARLCGSFPKASPVRRFIRARTEAGSVFVPEKGHSSGSIGTLAGCNCLIDIPAGSGPLQDGDEVRVWLF